MMESTIACIRQVSIGIALLLGQSCAAMAQVQGIITPAAPVAFEQVWVQVFCMDLETCVGASVSMSSNVITVMAATSNCLVCGYPTHLDVEIGRFPAGTYTVNIVEHGPPRTQHFTVTDPNQGAPLPLAQPLVDYTDQWWDPEEPGWGIAITQHVNGALFAVWAVYGSDNKPVWYTLQGGKWNIGFLGAYSGLVYRTAGPYFGGNYADGPSFNWTLAGTATLTFERPTNATLQFDVDGASGTKTITRLNF